MNRLSILFIAGLIAAGAQIITAQQNPALDKLFASAQHKADVEGDLKGAIEEYKAIVARAAANRVVAAQALLRMAGAYESLGDPQAREIYERLLRDYADQTAIAASARARMADRRAVSTDGPDNGLRQ